MGHVTGSTSHNLLFSKFGQPTRLVMKNTHADLLRNSSTIQNLKINGFKGTKKEKSQKILRPHSTIPVPNYSLLFWWGRTPSPHTHKGSHNQSQYPG